jgi:hypothetical protein
MDTLLNPLTECFRCGFSLSKTDNKEGIIVMSQDDNLMRFGPSVTTNYQLEVSCDTLEGEPIKFCSINCALCALSNLFHNDPSTFTFHCVVLAATYNAIIPGLPMTDKPRKYQVLRETLNRDPKTLKRWGGTVEYDVFRRDFICPKLDIEIDALLNSEQEETYQKRLPEDDADPENVVRPEEGNDADLSELNSVLYEKNDIEEGEFDSISDPAFK